MRGDTWNVRIALSDVDITMFLIVSSKTRSGAGNLLPEGVECDLANGCVCDFKPVYYLIISQARLIEGVELTWRVRGSKMMISP